VTEKTSPADKRVEGVQAGGAEASAGWYTLSAELAGRPDRVDGQRLRASLEDMARIGATPGGGVTRLALSDEDKRARDLFVEWLAELGLTVTIDEMGNIFGRRAGCDDALPPVLMGSHLDSQPQGGRFDGVYGVMGGLEVLRTLADHDIMTERPLVLVDWTDEEGSRFPPAMVASGVWAGKLEREWAWARADAGGTRLGDELARIGYRGDLPCRAFPFSAYFELHIEQGPRLEREGRTIGVPRGIVCLHWYDVVVRGQANQVGPTPMDGRHDSLVAAAEMIGAVRATAARLGSDLVATVGEIRNRPNSRNVIPGETSFTVDIRSWDDALALRAWQEMLESFAAVAQRHGCELGAEETWRVGHTEFDPALVELVGETAARLGYSTLPMVSGAGHDASYAATAGPTAMIFVPSVGGRSHVEAELTSWEDCAAGADVLLSCVLRAAGSGLSG
jgi:beta-ureidopropionase / N-carbamoyl-L-amino-acid hydrolase